MKRKYLILFSLSGLVLSLDQLTKYYFQNFFGDRVVELVPGVARLMTTRNNGFAFGLLQKAPPSLQEVFFIGVPVFALVLIVLIFIKLKDDQMLTSIALTTILAGAVGNLVDRLQHGYVIDFLNLRLGGAFHFPPFNIADGSIIIGVIIMFINTLLQERANAVRDTH